MTVMSVMAERGGGRGIGHRRPDGEFTKLGAVVEELLGVDDAEETAGDGGGVEVEGFGVDDLAGEDLVVDFGAGVIEDDDAGVLEALGAATVQGTAAGEVDAADDGVFEEIDFVVVFEAEGVLGVGDGFGEAIDEVGGRKVDPGGNRKAGVIEDVDGFSGGEVGLGFGWWWGEG